MKKHRTKLALSRETIRKLDALGAVAGARPPVTKSACATECIGSQNNCATDTCGLVCGTTATAIC